MSKHPMNTSDVISIEEARSKRLARQITPSGEPTSVTLLLDEHTPISPSSAEIMAEWTKLWAISRDDEPPEVKAYRHGAMRALRWVLFPDYRKPVSTYVAETEKMTFTEDPPCYGENI